MNNLTKSLTKTQAKKETSPDYLKESKIKVIEFCDALLNMNDDSCEEVLDKIRNYLKISQNKGRIIYSEISNFIFNLEEETVGTFLINIDKLLSYTLGKTGEDYVDLGKIIIKIYDHCNLANNQRAKIEEISQDISQVAGASLSKEVEKTKKQIEDDLKKELKHHEREYITILGIFASIVLAFVGGLIFSTSVLENINAISIYRLLLVIGLLAFVLINVIYLLVKFITAINDKPIKFRVWVYDIIVLVYLICVGITWIVLK